MTLTVKKIAFPEQQLVQTECEPVLTNALSLVGGVEVACLVRLGSLTMTINELRQLKSGQILPLQQKTHEPIDLLVNNQVIARGELMSCDDYFAIQITAIAG